MSIPTMTDWKQLALDKVAARDAAIPKEYLVDLAAHGIEPFPFGKEATPRTKDAEKPYKADWKVTRAIYPADSVLDVPRKVLDMQDVAITETPITELLSLLASGQLSSVRCTQAFFRRAILAHQLTNCCTEVFVDKTLAWAQKCDDYLKAEGKPMGLLHGLPVSLKDQFHIAGVVTTMGYVKDVKSVAEKNSVITDLLLRAGAVPLIRTNVPQSLMRAETDNHVYGRTSNPYNRSFTPGGSSGGEGALVGLHGSPLGLGTDIGGSVRIPAAFNGLWGFRPSMNRIPYEGSANSYMGQHTIYSVIGPMTHTFDGLVVFMRAILGERPWELDPIAMTMPFNEDSFALKDLGLKKGSAVDVEKEVYVAGKTKLCFAIEWDDGIVHPHPPITRALKEAKEKLEAAGHTVIDWIPLNHAAGYEIAGGIYDCDGGEDIRRSCEESGEPVMYQLMAEGNEGQITPSLSVYESWQLAQKRDIYRKEYLDCVNASVSQTGTGRPVDAILAPVAHAASVPHNKNDYVGYTSQWNLLDYPVVVMPITHVDPTKDKAHKLEKAYDDRDEEFWSLYDEDMWKGMPVNLGLVGKRLQDEELLGLAKVVADAGVSLL